MLVNKGFKFRILPNKEQMILIEKTFGCTRFVYNHFLDIQKKEYEKNRRIYSCTHIINEMKKLKDTEYPFLKEVDSTSLQQSLRHLDTAYKNCFRNKHFGTPKFKSKKHSSKSYTSMNNNSCIYIEDGTIQLPKLKKVRINMHRQLPKDARITSAVISKTATGKYNVSLTCSYEIEDRYVDPNSDSVIGLDYAMNGLYIDSHGKSAQYDRYYHQSLTKLQREQRRLSKCAYQSNNYYKQLKKVAKVHEKVRNQRRDFLHKCSTQIANEYDIVCIEDLNMKAMSQALHFGKSVHDNGWGLFTTFLHYKLNERGKILKKVDKWYASTKTCHICGYKIDTLGLNEREWTCPICGSEHDRDENAAINILNEGIRMIQTEKVFA